MPFLYRKLPNGVVVVTHFYVPIALHIHKAARIFILPSVLLRVREVSPDPETYSASATILSVREVPLGPEIHSASADGT